MKLKAYSRQEADWLQRQLSLFLERVSKSEDIPVKLKSRIRDDILSDDWTITTRTFPHGRKFRGVCNHNRKVVIIAKKDPAVVGHECTHLCGGNEIDAETMENLLYTKKEGATEPDDIYDSWQFDIEKTPDLLPRKLTSRIVGMP